LRDSLDQSPPLTVTDDDEDERSGLARSSSRLPSLRTASARNDGAIGDNQEQALKSLDVRPPCLVTAPGIVFIGLAGYDWGPRRADS